MSSWNRRCALGLAGLGLLASGAAAWSADSSALRDAITVVNMRAHQAALQAIADANGGNRAAGTPGRDATVDYLMERLEEAGYAPRIEEFAFPRFTETGPPVLERLRPKPETFTGPANIETFTFSGVGTVTGRVVPTNDIVIPPTPASSSTSGCEAGDFPPAPPGPAIALVQRGFCPFATKGSLAQAAGYDGIIIFNEGQEGRTDPIPDVSIGIDVTVPAVFTSFAIGEELYRQSQSARVQASVTVNGTSEPQPGYNVVADTEGGRDDRIVVVGGHLDSVEAGPGINDNGSGMAAILEIAIQMRRLGIAPRNTVRFAFWDAEELGLIGSERYVQSLSEAQRARIMANLNFDMLGSPNFVRFVYDGDGSAFGTAGPGGSDEIERIFESFFGNRGIPTAPTAFDGRSDYGPFIAIGIPAGGLFSGAEGIKTPEQEDLFGGEAGVAYDPCYHIACDRQKNRSREGLSDLADAAAHAVLQLGQRSVSIREPAATAAASAGGAAAHAGDDLAYWGDSLRR